MKLRNALHSALDDALNKLLVLDGVDNFGIVDLRVTNTCCDEDLEHSTVSWVNMKLCGLVTQDWVLEELSHKTIKEKI